MTPAKVEDIVGKTKKDHTTDGEKCTDELGKLEEREDRDGTNK